MPNIARPSAVFSVDTLLDDVQANAAISQLSAERHEEQYRPAEAVETLDLQRVAVASISASRRASGGWPSRRWRARRRCPSADAGAAERVDVVVGFWSAVGRGRSRNSTRREDSASQHYRRSFSTRVVDTARARKRSDQPPLPRCRQTSICRRFYVATGARSMMAPELGGRAAVAIRWHFVRSTRCPGSTAPDHSHPCSLRRCVYAIAQPAGGGRAQAGPLRTALQRVGCDAAAGLAPEKDHSWRGNPWRGLDQCDFSLGEMRPADNSMQETALRRRSQLTRPSELVVPAIDCDGRCSPEKPEQAYAGDGDNGTHKEDDGESAPHAAVCRTLTRCVSLDVRERHYRLPNTLVEPLDSASWDVSPSTWRVDSSPR